MSCDAITARRDFTFFKVNGVFVCQSQKWAWTVPSGCDHTEWCEIA